MNKTEQGNQCYSYKTKEMCFLFSWQQTTIQFVFNFQAFPLTLFTDPRYTYIMSHPLDYLMHICCYHTTTWHWCARPVADAANDRSTDVWLRLLANQRLCLLVVMDTTTQLIMTFDFSHISSHRSGESWKLHSNFKE